MFLHINKFLGTEIWKPYWVKVSIAVFWGQAAVWLRPEVTILSYGFGQGCLIELIAWCGTGVLDRGDEQTGTLETTPTSNLRAARITTGVSWHRASSSRISWIKLLKAPYSFLPRIMLRSHKRCCEPTYPSRWLQNPTFLQHTALGYRYSCCYSNKRHPRLLFVTKKLPAFLSY